MVEASLEGQVTDRASGDDAASRQAKRWARCPRQPAADERCGFLFVVGQPRITGSVQATINPDAIRRAVRCRPAVAFEPALNEPEAMGSDCPRSHRPDYVTIAGTRNFAAVEDELTPRSERNVSVEGPSRTRWLAPPGMQVDLPSTNRAVAQIGQVVRTTSAPILLRGHSRTLSRAVAVAAARSASLIRGPT
jgi:hypothetical protein